MIIKVAKSAGFCFGVERAVNGVIAWAKANKDKNVKVYGMLIHNSYVIERLKELNIKVIEDINEVGKDDIVFIRSHGVSTDEFSEIEKRASKVYDFTCPYVKKIHEIVREWSVNGNDVIVVGDINHPEVKGTIGHVEKGRKCIVIDSVEKAKDAITQLGSKAIVVCQTTFDNAKWQEIKDYIENNTDYRVFDTICKATINRQQEAKVLAHEVDVMLVIGDRKSSNTNKLYEAIKEIKPTYFIETLKDLEGIDFSKVRTIGITAGASTSQEQIDEVVHALERKFNEVDIYDFEKLLDKSFKDIKKGEIVKGKIVKVEEDYVLVDIGYKAEGIIYKNEIFKNANANLKEIFKENEMIEAVVVKESDEEGNVVLSKLKADNIHGFEELLSKFESKIPVKIVVKQIREKNIVGEFRGINVFVPISQWAEEVSSSIVGKVFEVEIVNIDSEKKIAFGSRRALLRQAQEQRLVEALENLDFNKDYEGFVAEIREKGIIVDFEGLRGFVPLSEISYSKRAEDIKKIFKIGERVKVRVIDVDKQKKQIFLSIKKTQEDEWIKKVKDLYLGMLVDVEITKVLPFGLVVLISDCGLDGFVHISNIPLGYNQRLHKLYKVGDKTKAKIVEIDEQRRRIGLSLKDLHEEEEQIPQYKENFVITIADMVKNIKLEG
ncbi:4-hydroxy-3-methylbut-2-enyl diphosphate reductase [Caldicellulosiruptor naganoensis]|uniref:4-hydroxy-3-methylbut-2-enyl diphosphate reductase n=1 Tax=Caldicellulosiruptor naganoensis TaxID=29324 RepID=A0ABY7BE47_9FIRM|nr:4-hydroxy-3-methylbut-2-enyl diphosphate reductase [Caldicellulosiruptor naganoensis]WAM30637.1 4-hydroxy-3-methylbut-2-enyl diphosphate reductase [Caldicellulosiruptor naganoensis]